MCLCNALRIFFNLNVVCRTGKLVYNPIPVAQKFVNGMIWFLKYRLG